ncbi:MAG: o-succinylbenzoate synthase [Bacteroidota bacterium]
MRVETVDLVPYRLPLTEAVTWNGERCTTREGALLRLGDDRGRTGWGDLAPLPGFSRETLPEAMKALTEALPELLRRGLDPSDLTQPSGSFHTTLDAAGLPSSARFALDLALADLAAQALGQTLPEALSANVATQLPLNGLLMGSPEAVVAQARRLGAGGYPAVKLKVGRAAVETDIETVRAVREALGESVALRLDANRAWADDDARRFADAVVPLGLDYIEEPLADPAGLAALARDTGLPVAVDESVQEGAAIEAWAAAAVLKPMLVGGLMATLRLAASAWSVGVRTVLSASFESGIGLRGVAALAAATGAQPAGLDTYRWLAEDVVGPLPFGRPVVDVPTLFAAPPEVAVP